MIISISVVQVGLYVVLDRTKFKNLKGLVLILLLTGHIFVFPKMFYPKLGPDAGCAMPIVGVILAFWVLGLLFTTVTHVIYLIATRKKELRREVNKPAT